MNDLLLAAFALFLIVILAIDNRHYGHVWSDHKEDRHH